MKPFKSKKHKKKVNHLILFTTDAADSKVSQIRLTPFRFWAVVFLLCIIAGILVGFLVYGGSLHRYYLDAQKKTEAAIAVLEDEKAQLEAENEKLDEKVQILSETVNQKVQAEKEEVALLAEMCVPTDFPLTGSAQVEETTTLTTQTDDGDDAEETDAGQAVADEEAAEGDEASAEDWPICIFTATEGATAVAAGNGTVVEVSEDPEYGYRVIIDHGNGYQSIYLNQGDPKVKEGDSISRGVTIYVIGSENISLGYQITKDGSYINPMDIIAISG